MAGSSFRFVYVFSVGIFEAVDSSGQLSGAGAESQGAEIKLPPEAKCEIMNSGSFLFTTDLKKY
jgi:hypothetical protein